MIAVEPLRPDDGEAWDEFARGTSGGLLYHSIAYRDLLVELLGCEAEYLTAREGGEIRGVLPIMWATDDRGRICNSLPFFGSHGSPLSADADADTALLAAWGERVGAEGTLAATMVSNPFRDRDAPAPSFNLEDARIGQVTALPEPEPDRLMAIYSKNARRDVRRAERRGVEVRSDPDRLGELGSMHEQNIAAIGGQTKPGSFFEAIPRHFRPGEDYDVWAAYKGHAMIAGLLVLYFNRVAEYFVPAVDRDHQADEPMALILLRAMVEAARKGCRSWNWGGTWSSQDGVYSFKRKWGATDLPYRYFVQVNDDALLDSTPEDLRERFPFFYVAPFSALRSQEVSR